MDIPDDMDRREYLDRECCPVQQGTRVALERCDSYDFPNVLAAVRSVLQPFGGMESFVKPGARVLLKPNYVVARASQQAATTHPSILLAAAQLVHECRGEPFVADSPAFGGAEGAAHKSGLNAAAAHIPLPVVSLRGPVRCPVRGTACPGLKISVAALQADVVINLPKFKAHRQMLMTLAVKNMFGCVPGRRKAWLHMAVRNDLRRFARMLVEAYVAVRPALTIVDGIIGMEGDGPVSGSPKHMGLVMAGTDGVAIDRVGCELAGLPWERLHTLIAAREAGIGETDLSRIAIAGRTITEMRVTDFRFPEPIPISFSPYRLVRGWIRSMLMCYRQAKRIQAEERSR